MLIYIFSLCVYSHYFCALTLKVKLLLRQVRESVIVLYGKPNVYDILSVSVMNVYHINHIYRTAKRFTGISLCKFSANIWRVFCTVRLIAANQYTCLNFVLVSPPSKTLSHPHYCNHNFTYRFKTLFLFSW